MEIITAFSDEFVFNANGDLTLFGKSLKILIIFIITNIIIKVIGKLIDKGLKNKKFNSGKRANTLGQILKKVIKYFLIFIWIVMSLELFGINTGSIIATAGIGGLAIGFGAQSLVKDIITGFFILLEDQYAVGDYVKIGSYQGTVEELGLRVTKLRDFNGELHIIPNSSIQIVTNSTRGAMRALVEIPLSYEENIDKAIMVLEAICAEVKQNNVNIIEGPTILGVTKLADYSVNITIVAKTKPMEQWYIERVIRKKVKEAFDKEKIEISYPKRVIMEVEK